MSWLNLLSTLRKFPFLGIYVVMFTDVLQTFLKFSLIILLFIVAFSLGFHALIGDQVIFILIHRLIFNWFHPLLLLFIHLISDELNCIKKVTKYVIFPNLLNREYLMRFNMQWWRQRSWWLVNLNTIQYFSAQHQDNYITSHWRSYFFSHFWL